LIDQRSDGVDERDAGAHQVASWRVITAMSAVPMRRMNLTDRGRPSSSPWPPPLVAAVRRNAVARRTVRSALAFSRRARPW